MDEQKAILFDEELNLRVVDPAKFKESLQLQEESSNFLTSLVLHSFILPLLRDENKFILLDLNN